MAVVRDDDDRIEIELVEHDPPRRRSRSPAPASAPAPDVAKASRDDPAAGQPARRSGRTVALVVGVGVLGLLVGWLTGRAGGEEPEAVAPATPPATSAAPPASFGDDPALVEPATPRLEPRRTAPERTTTTTVPDVVSVSPIPDVDPALIGLPYEIITEDGLGNVRFIDLASNTMTSIDGNRGGDIGRIFAGDGWLLVPNGSSQRALVYRDGNPEPESLAIPAPWSAAHAPGAPTLWVPDERLAGNQPGAMVEIDITGEPTGATVPLPAQPLLLDASGAFVVQAAGGTYAVTGEGATRLTTGYLVAAGAAAVLAMECDESLACSYVAVDRLTGARTTLPDPFGGVRVESAQWWSQSTEAVSPDGSVAIVLVPEFGSGNDQDVVIGMQPVAVDLRTGASTEIEQRARSWVFSVHWTADSRYAFFFDNGDVFAYSPESGERLRAGPDEGATRRPQSFAMRPSDGTPWAER